MILLATFSMVNPEGILQNNQLTFALIVVIWAGLLFLLFVLIVIVLSVFSIGCASFFNLLIFNNN